MGASRLRVNPQYIVNDLNVYPGNKVSVEVGLGYAVAHLVEALCYKRKVEVSIPDGVIGIFH